MYERKSWTEKEDRVLSKLRDQRNIKKWSQIAQLMDTEFGITGRNGKQCRQRYHNHLAQDLSKKGWSEEEERLLFLLHSYYGNKWASISKQLPGRADNCIKNRFYSLFKRGIKNINTLIRNTQKKIFKKIKSNLIGKIVMAIQRHNKSPCDISRRCLSYATEIQQKILQYCFKKPDDNAQSEKLRKQLTVLGDKIKAFLIFSRSKVPNQRAGYRLIQQQKDNSSQKHTQIQIVQSQNANFSKNCINLKYNVTMKKIQQENQSCD